MDSSSSLIAKLAQTSQTSHDVHGLVNVKLFLGVGGIFVLDLLPQSEKKQVKGEDKLVKFYFTKSTCI